MTGRPTERLVPRFARAALPREAGCADYEFPAAPLALDSGADYAPDAISSAFGADFPASSRKTVGTAPGASAASPGAVSLSDATLILLGSIALHDDLSIPSLITELAAARAKQIGLGVLARAVLDADASADSHAEHPAASLGNGHANSRAGDLHDLPDFERTPATRFQKGGSR